MTIKDFYTDYQTTNGHPPTEEEWVDYFASFVDDQRLHKDEQDECGE